MAAASSTSSSAVGRVLALLSVSFFGVAVGMMTERANTKRPEQGEKLSVMDNLQSLSPFMQKTVSKGIPSDERVRFYDGFVASLNYERRIPNWVLEHLPNPSIAATRKEEGKKEEIKGSDEDESAAVRRETMKFFADTTIPETFRVLPDDYSGGKQQQQPNTRGLSRGHLAAAQFHKNSSKEMAETFNMNANIVPQDMTMNAVDWLRLENLMKKLLRRYEGGLWVVTGPVFSPRYVYGDPRSWGWTESRSTSAIKPAADPSDNVNAEAKKPRKVICYELVGKHDVAVPTHLFKVVLGERADGVHEIAAFLMPNEPITHEQPLVSYQVPVSEIERATGLQFFRNVVSPREVDTMAPWKGRKSLAQGLDSLPNMCGRFSCEVRTAALFQTYRSVAQLRAAQSLQELQQVFNQLNVDQQQQKQQQHSRGSEKSQQLDAVVMKEYEERRKELMLEAVSSHVEK